MGATVLPVLRDIQPETFLPSSRSVAFRRAAWAAVGGYPEWLDYSEDLVFDLGLAGRRGAAFCSAPRALVSFARGSLARAFFRQYYLYARGDGKADLWRKRHAIRYATYLGGAGPAPAAGARAGGWALGAAGAGRRGALLRHPRPPPERRARRSGAGADGAGHAGEQPATPCALIPVIRVVGDLAKLIGYPVGWWWRLKNRPPNWHDL